MSLITCCPSCGTKFRVVADQLRISDGWVRCGRCQEVFDATQALQPSAPVLPTAPAVPVPMPQPKVAESVAEQPSPVVDVATVGQVPISPEVSQELVPADMGYELPAALEDAAAHEALWQVTPGNDKRAAELQRPSATANLEVEPPWKEPHWTESTEEIALEIPAALSWEPEQALRAEEAQAEQWAASLAQPDKEPGSDVPSSAEIAAPASSAAETGVPLQPRLQQVAPHEVATGESVDALDSGLEHIPEFVRQAQRKAWWNKPAVRFVMGMLVTLLPLALVLQVAVHERNTLIAWKPQWRPAFASMCVALRCELAPRKHIASVVLTGSSFHEDLQPNHYQLGLSIQNQSVASVATPAVELTLTDSQDQVLVRKVLLPAEIGAPVELAARSEWTGALKVATQDLLLPVSGYRVMAFYP